MLFTLHSVPAAAATKPPLPPFHGSVQVVPAATRQALKHAHLWHPGCPTPLSHLRLLTVSFVGFDRVAELSVLDFPPGLAVVLDELPGSPLLSSVPPLTEPVGGDTEPQPIR